MTSARILLALAPLLAGLLWTGCGQPKGKALGKAPEGSPRTILAVQAGDTPAVVAIQGRLVEKCPVAGCWFRIEDATGIIKVDTKAAGFVVTGIPLQTAITVAGKVAMEGAETILEATGLRY
jgi:uncharacterized protein YdeI (BOF family)